MNIRHGDMCLIGIEKLPEGLVPAKTNVLMRGSGGNDHAFTEGTFYPTTKDQFVFGYFVAQKGCKLLHPDHGKKIKKKSLREASVPEGIYELRRQFEDTHEGMKEVVD